MRQKLHSLKRMKLRQSWNKYNLYNISRDSLPPFFEQSTLFQRKWRAKSLTRAYHGEKIREHQWQRMFESRIRSKITMPHTYLAKSDGSEMAAGRGSGLDEAPGEEKKKLVKIPYMNMAYAPLERRLDTAIFRALFASSTRQARQFVIHGFVKVNGERMIYPGYLLNPGDMFQVDPERVLFATGAPKDRREARLSRRARKAALQLAGKQSRDADSEAAATTEIQGSGDDGETATGKPASEADKRREEIDPKEKLQKLLSSAKQLLSDPKDVLPAKRKQDLRAFQRLLKRSLSKPSSQNTILTDSLDAQLQEITSKLSLQDVPVTKSEEGSETPEPKGGISEEDKKTLRVALREARENPEDHSKPYATPWRPRDYMSAFAFIPRYLEVNHNICSAIYLRHPVAKPGLAEVPTPFEIDINQLAFNWYLRRR